MLRNAVGMIAVLLTSHALPHAARGGELVFDLRFDEIAAYCEYLPIEAGVYFLVTEYAGSFSCGTGGCAIAEPAGLLMSPASLVVHVWDLNILGVTGFEVDVIERDVGLSATLRAEVPEGAPEYTSTTTTQGATTLVINSAGEPLSTAEISCCACTIVEVRLVGADIVPLRGKSWGMLKSTFD